MEFKILEAVYNGMRFRIEEDFPEVGTYLLIYKNEECIKDYLQNSVRDCIEIALEEYEVPFIQWNEIPALGTSACL